jgi:RHS repeat-associated protein
LQNLHYTYDPTGNLTSIRDEAQQDVYFRNGRVEARNDYVYDALYRLIQASGREHLGQGGASIAHSHNDAGRVGLPSADASGRFAPNDGKAMARYIERYVHDAAGNVLKMQHRGSDPSHSGWARTFDFLEASLIQDGVASNRLSSTWLNPAGSSAQPETCLHDPHGNLLRLSHLGGGSPGPNMHWDYKDQLRQADLGGGANAFYVYDAAGQRVRKVWEKAPGLIEERIYLGGFEIFRRHGGPVGAGSATLERETLHVMDDKQRIALVETRTLDSAGSDGAPRQLIRYQFGNHLGSASLELDEEAHIISYEEYAPYGSSTYQAVRSQTETAKRYRYTGRERDAESGFYYHGARYFAPWLCRWVSCDPLQLEAGPNLYLYCDANPLNRTDPGGKDWEFCNPFTDDQCSVASTYEVAAEKAGEAGQYLRESAPAQFVTGLAVGGLAGATPGGFTVGIGGELTGAAEEFPRAFRMGYGLGETAWGIAQIVVGGVGEVGGGALALGGAGATATGAGAPVGVPAMAGGVGLMGVSTAAIVEGSADVVTGFGVFMSAWRSGDDLPEGTHKVVDEADLNRDQTRSLRPAEALEESLEQAGMPRPPGHEPHHIAAASDPRAARAVEILDEAGIGVNDAPNGVWLPRTSQAARTGQPIQAQAATSHDTIHSARYYEALTERLERAREADRVYEELEFIRTELELGYQFW